MNIDRKKSETRMKKLAIAFIVFIVSACSVYAQNKLVKGRAISDQFDVLIGIPIMIDDTVKVGKTDLDGFFQINVPDSVKELKFVYVGLDPTPIVLFDNCVDIEVVMMLTGTFDFMSLKKADKLRMKRFKNLPEIHREAFLKGIFKTEEACYTQVFVPFYERKE
jgi:hypothetical protein